MKKAFTLLEVVISITIFMIILIFLYKTLDDTKVTNEKFEKHLYENDSVNSLYKIFLEDIAESRGEVVISLDKEKNSIAIFKSNNSYHDPFYSNITYMISSNAKLVRIESLKPFEKEKTEFEFYKSSFIDTLLDNVEKFVIVQDLDKYVFIIKQKDKEKIMFSTFKMMED